MPPLSDPGFARFQHLVREAAGISLTDAKRSLLVGRLTRRVRELGLESFDAYYARVEQSPEERVHMLDCVSTNETHFFREPQHFQYLCERVLPAWRAQAAAGTRSRTVRAWSAACSTGEEPFSLAMLLMEHLPAEEGWKVEVLATDLSTRVLRAAEAATWPLARARDIPEAYLKRYMLEGTGPQAGRMRACTALRERIRWARLNLVEQPWPQALFDVPFDLVFCRNVLMYFDPDCKARVVRRLLERLAPDGLFFVGHAESLLGLGAGIGVAPRAPTIYGRAR
nr:MULTISPECIES: protein-glutamate O-methyltransferase CheR [Myxococcaceae]